MLPSKNKVKIVQMQKKHPIKKTFLAAVLLAITGAASAQNPAPQCELDRPVKFGGMNWESNLLLVDVEKFIVEHGFGCKTLVEQGDTLPMFAALQRGDVDINAEVWATQMQEPWDKAIADKTVIPVGTVFTGTDGWYIPRYTAEKFPNLRKVSDLKGMAEHFRDPEERNKGRIYGCAVGWTCGIINKNLATAYGLNDEYVVYSPGTSAAQRAAITSDYRRKRDVVFYYWTPTSVMGSLDLVKLELPPVDKKKLACITDPDCQDPQPTGLQPYPVRTVVNATFAEQAPKLVEFLSRVSVPDATVSSVLARMEEEKLEISEGAALFLKEHGDIWREWVSTDVGDRVQQALNSRKG